MTRFLARPKKYMAITILFILFRGAIVLSATTYKELGDTVWSDFRQQFPFPFRTVACQQGNEGERVYIISEPHDDITESDVERVFDGFVHQIWTNSMRIGYDGHITDIIIYTKCIPSFYHEEIVRRLNILLYGSDYKSMYLNLPFNGKAKPSFYNDEINVKVNDKALHKWVFDENRTLSNLLTGGSSTVERIVSQQLYGVYECRSCDIIIWALASHQDISDEWEHFHVFTVESDLLLGAIYSKGVVMIVGRKRKLDRISMPSLRIDDAFMLANAGSRVSQSLNIASVVYCKIDGKYDWCPAWVSDNIEHSEYAYWLTLTDIYLKYWLQDKPFIAIGYDINQPLHTFDSSLLDDYNAIRYNWNTEDYVSITTYDEGIILHFNNIGCLNCNLFDIADNKRLSHFDKGVYEYFLQLRNPDVVRVAQYTMLYEIFNAFGITAIKQDNRYYNKSLITSPLVPSSREILSKIKELSDFDIDGISRNIYSSEIEPIINQATDSELIEILGISSVIEGLREQRKDTTKSLIADDIRRQISISKRQFREAFCLERIALPIEELRNKLRNLPESQFDHLCEFTAAPNQYSGSDLSAIEAISNSINGCFVVSYYAKHFGFDMRRLVDDYVLCHKSTGRKWFKGPSIVVIDDGRNSRDMLYNHIVSIGGHTITAGGKEAPRSIVTQGSGILTLSGDPLRDAEYYGHKAVSSTTAEEKMFYIRQSKEALSQNISKTNASDQYDNLLSRIERVIFEESQIRYNAQVKKKEINQDSNEVVKIAETELASGRNLTSKERDAYAFIIDNASKIINQTDNKTNDELEDEELKALREKLRRLQLTLAELKIQRGKS